MRFLSFNYIDDLCLKYFNFISHTHTHTHTHTHIYIYIYIYIYTQESYNK